MSYLNKKDKIFYDGEFIYLPHSRSAHKLKKYYSATDMRSWCDSVEQRRQHIIELMSRERQCLEKYLPVDRVLNMRLKGESDGNNDGGEGQGGGRQGGNKGVKENSEEKKNLQKRIDYLQKEIDKYDRLPLDEEQKKEVERLKKKYGLVPPPK